MPRPGVDVRITEPAPTGGAVLDTSQGFFVQCAQMGPTDVAVKVRSLKEWEKRFGGRAGPAITTHDAVRGFFNEQGSVLHFARAQGAAAVAASGAIPPLDATAASSGTWGNDLSIALEADTTLLAQAAQASKRKPNRRPHAAEQTNGNGNGAAARGAGVRVVVTWGDVVEKSTLCVTAGEAVAWSASSKFVSLSAVDESAPLAVAAAVTLDGGVDADVLDENTVGKALDLFSSALGPGQVACPGATEGAIHDVVLAFCEKTRRCALIDLADDDAVTVEAEVMGLYGNAGSKFAAAMAPRIMYVGPVPNTQILVPYSAIQAGVIARADRQTGNPNEAAAGTNGIILGARGLGTEFTDDEREALNEAGVTLAKSVNGVIRTYGSRTCAGPDETNWLWFANSRVIMSISYEADAIGEHYVHKQIDAKRKIFTSLEQDLGGICLKYVTMEALWSFYVDTGPAQNTPDTIVNGEIHAVIGLKVSPSAEWVLIEISKSQLNA